MLPAELAKYKPLYLQTAWDYIRTLETNLHLLQSEPDNQDAISSLHVCAHSLKSQSLVMQFTHLGALCYALERLFKALKDGQQQLNATELETLSQVVEYLKKSLAEISAHDSDIPLSETESLVEQMLNEGGRT